ncbi:MAG: competence protein ComEA, partial [Negativicutes bacterium]|nr:competence protein ComEA [Negativicutes bacterium]
MDAQRRKLLLLIAVVAAIGAISFFSYWQKTSVTDIATTGAPMTAQQATAASGSGEAVVYISGAVNKPGVYKVSPNT